MLEADHYSNYWQDLYKVNSEAGDLSEEVDRIINGTTSPFWFWFGKDEWQRKFGWALRDGEPATKLFDDLFSRLKEFVHNQ